MTRNISVILGVSDLSEMRGCPRYKGMNPAVTSHERNDGRPASDGPRWWNPGRVEIEPKRFRRTETGTYASNAARNCPLTAFSPATRTVPAGFA